VKTRSSRPARGTKSLIFGDGRRGLPRRMFPSGEGADGWRFLAYGFDACHERGATRPCRGSSRQLALAGSIVYRRRCYRGRTTSLRQAFFSSFTLRAGDFSFAIVWLLPCRTVDVCKPSILVSVRFWQTRGLESTGNSFNGVCGALVYWCRLGGRDPGMVSP